MPQAWLFSFAQTFILAFAFMLQPCRKLDPSVNCVDYWFIHRCKILSAGLTVGAADDERLRSENETYRTGDSGEGNAWKAQESVQFTFIYTVSAMAKIVSWHLTETLSLTPNQATVAGKTFRAKRKEKPWAGPDFYRRDLLLLKKV